MTRRSRPLPGPRRFCFLRAVVVVCAGLVGNACGGSSSETPPPLEPLPVNLHYDRSSTALAGELPVVAADAGVVVRAQDETSETNEGPPARSTWGADEGARPTPLK